jgi:hypothetical protein
VKLNLGCGSNKPAGFIHVDRYAGCAPDLLVDLEQTPWPWANDSIDAVLFHHSLEHLGASVEAFQAIIQELYRVLRAGAEVQINVPHPRHDDFIHDPTHVRPITPAMLMLLNKKANLHLQSAGAPNTPLGMIWNVDFAIKKVEFGLDEHYAGMLADGRISQRELEAFSRERNNVIREIRILMLAVK